MVLTWRLPADLCPCYSFYSKAISGAGLRHEDIDIFEAHDAYTIMGCLSYEVGARAGR